MGTYTSHLRQALPDKLAHNDQISEFVISNLSKLFDQHYNDRGRCRLLLSIVDRFGGVVTGNTINILIDKYYKHDSDLGDIKIIELDVVFFNISTIPKFFNGKNFIINNETQYDSNEHFVIKSLLWEYVAKINVIVVSTGINDVYIRNFKLRTCCFNSINPKLLAYRQAQLQYMNNKIKNYLDSLCANCQDVYKNNTYSQFCSLKCDQCSITRYRYYMISN